MVMVRVDETPALSLGVKHLICVEVDDNTTQGSLAVGAEAKVIARVLPSFIDEGNPVPSIVRSAAPLGLIPVFGVIDEAVMPTAIGAPDTGIYPAASLTYGCHAVPATAEIVHVI
jgi:hypothetical protein